TAISRVNMAVESPDGAESALDAVHHRRKSHQPERSRIYYSRFLHIDAPDAARKHRDQFQSTLRASFTPAPGFAARLRPWAILSDRLQSIVRIAHAAAGLSIRHANAYLSSSR